MNTTDTRPLEEITAEIDIVCESRHGCDRPAQWITENTPNYCGCRTLRLICTTHLNAWVSSFGLVRYWRCPCGSVSDLPSTWNEAHVLHRIEAL